MRIAIAAHDDRVSPVFDVARRLIVVDADAADNVASSRREMALNGAALTARVREIKEAEIAVLICGAISRPLEAALVAEGIEVIPQICGETEEVLAAYFARQLSDDRYLMPGCCGRRRGQCHGHDTHDAAKPGRGMRRQGGQAGQGGRGRGCGYGNGGRQSGGMGKGRASQRPRGRGGRGTRT